MVFLASCIYAFKLVFKSLSSLPSPFRVIIGLELHWMGDRSVGGKEEKKSANLEFFTQTSLTTVLDRAEKPECMFQRQRFIRKLQPISGFALISLFCLPATCGFHISSFSIFLYYSTLFFGEEPGL